MGSSAFFPRLITMDDATLASKLNNLSAELSKQLIDALDGGTYPNNGIKLVASLQQKLSHVPELSQQLLDQIEKNVPCDQRSFEILKVLNKIPTVTPQIFLQALFDIELTSIANELSIAMRLPKPNGSKVPIVFSNNEAKTCGTGLLKESLNTFLSSRLLLGIKIYQTLAIESFAPDNWELVAKNLKTIPRLSAFFDEVDLKKINQGPNSSITSERFLKYVKSLGVTVEELVIALVQIGHLQNLCQKILNETTTPDYFRKHFKAGLTPATFNDVRLDQALWQFLNYEWKLINHIIDTIDSYPDPIKVWANIISHFNDHPYFKDEFEPSPIVWCQNIAMKFSNASSAGDALLMRLSYHAGISVGSFANALLATDKRLNVLCDQMYTAETHAFMLVPGSKAEDGPVILRSYK